MSSLIKARRSISRLSEQVKNLKSQVEDYRSRVSHEAKDLFGAVRWLHSALWQIYGGYPIPSLEESIDRGSCRLHFRDTEAVSLKSRPTWDAHLLDRGHGDNDYETVHLYVQYFVAWNTGKIGRSRRDPVGVECWKVASEAFAGGVADTIEETIAKIEQHRFGHFPERKVNYVAIIRRKLIATSNFGDITGCDIYRFPKRWQPSPRAIAKGTVCRSPYRDPRVKIGDAEPDEK
jgi:hypothetical protein